MNKIRTLALAGPALLTLVAPLVAAASPGSPSFESEFLSQGLFVTYLLAFGYGLASVFNGCVYPLIPITLSVIGARGASSKGKAFASAGIYVLGLATMYTALGVTAALVGNLFGFSYQNPYLMGFVVAVFLAMGLSMLGAWELKLPTAWTRRITAGRGHYTGVFLMGVVSGIVAAPCAGPFVISLLGYVSNTQDVAIGGTTLFVFSLGLGLPFLILGTFSGALARMPKSGPWLAAVKYACGAVMLGFGLYYLRYVLGTEAAPIVAGAILAVTGAIAAFKVVPAEWSDRLLRWGGVAAALGGIALTSIGIHGAVSGREAAVSPIAWMTSMHEARERALAEQKPMLVDFWATWCESCETIEREVLWNPAVVDEAKRFVAVKVDSSKRSPQIDALHKRYGIQGLPAVVLLDPQKDSSVTITERLEPQEMAARMRQLRCAGKPQC